MAFSKLTPPFKNLCGSQEYSKLTREDSEVEMKVDWKKFNPKVGKTGDKFSSSPFPSDRNADFKWRINFYPLGYNDDSSGYSSIFLTLIWTRVKTAIPVIRRFEIKTPSNKIIESQETERTYKNNESWGFLKFWKVNDLGADFLIIRVQVCAYYEVNTNATSNFLSERTLLRDYSSLLESSEYSDIVICAGSEKSSVRYEAHRVILASRSKVFAAMLSKDMKEKQTGCIQINDLSSSAIKGMLKFIYGCEVDFTDLKMTLELLEASEKYDLKDLKCQCAEYLTSVLNENNTATILDHAERYSLADLKITTLEYIYKNKDKFSNKQQYQIILKENPTLLLDIIAKLSVHNNEVKTETDEKKNSERNNDEEDSDECENDGWGSVDNSYNRRNTNWRGYNRYNPRSNYGGSPWGGRYG